MKLTVIDTPGFGDYVNNRDRSVCPFQSSSRASSRDRTDEGESVQLGTDRRVCG